MVEAAQTILREKAAASSLPDNNPSASSPKIKPPENLLSFPIEFSTLQDSEDDEDDEDVAYKHYGGPHVAKRRTPHGTRKWTLDDQQQLARMKREGWDDERIGSGLGRTPAAVQQQWRTM